MDSSHELDPMADLEDLGNLFEFGDIDLSTIADSGQYSEHLQQQHATHPSTPFQELGEPNPVPVTSTHDFGGPAQFAFSHDMGQQHYLHRQKSNAPTSHPYHAETLYQPSVQQTYNPYTPGLQFQTQAAFPPNHHVPPTPNSYEMHGETGRFMQQQQHLDPQQRAILEQRYHVRKDDAIAFTPMVSPAGTPQYNMLPEFTVPGAYFSPLTSPMLLAQTQQAQLQQQHAHRPNPSTAPNSNTISPVDPSIDLEMLDSVILPESAGSKPRRSRRKAATPKNATASGRARQSPAQQAQKRKSLPLSSNVPHSTPENLLQRSITSQPSANLQMRPHFESSGDSISPEPLSESIMGPPPRPASSLNVSPALAGQQQQQYTTNFSIGAAATPKSLLATRGSQQLVDGRQDPVSGSTQSWSGLNGLDDLSLPEAATGQARRKPSLTQINTQLIPPDETTTQLSARKTPKLGPSSTPASARPSSAVGSPAIAESPMTASTPSAILTEKKDNKGGRGNKKRPSMSGSNSKLVSPAIVPKISPSIKPLLPEGTPLNTATQALLLASKSNYQNLLEGNHLPGVTYPDSLSTGLTSKRTSHKVAEQGRRNRINEALKEMQALIPRSNAHRTPNGEGDNELEMGDDEKVTDGGSKEDATAKSNSSKAATVELANEYIRRMQKEQAMQNADLLQLRLENEQLKKRLTGQDGTPVDSPAPTSTSSQASSGRAQ